MKSGSEYSRAFSTLGCPELGLDEVRALAAKFQLDAVELRALGGSFNLPQYFAATFGSPAALAAKLAGKGVSVTSLGTSLRLIGSTEQDREEFLKFVPWAEALGLGHLRVFDGGTNGSPAEIARAVDCLGWWRSLRAERGWKTELMVETHDALITTPAILRLVEQAPDVAILWDTHHTWRKGQEAPSETWRQIKANVVHIHVKDSVSAPESKNGYLYVAPGRGEFPMSTLRPVLRSEFTGAVSLEWEKYWVSYLGSLESALQSAKECEWW